VNKKRQKSNRRRQLAKSRKGTIRSPRKQKAPVAKQEATTSAMADVWIAVAIVALVVGAFVALWYFAVRKPSQSPINPTIEVQAPTMTKEIELNTTPVSQATSSEPKAMSWPEPPKMALDLDKSYEAVIKTAKGDIRLELYADKAPKTVNSFVFLARQGFYDGVTFHRVIPGFMAQAGDPTGTGSGGPGYTFDNEISPDLRHDSAGILSMANAGPDTNGSQFFITYAPQPSLDGHYSVFGKVIEGMDVVRALTPRNSAENPNAPAGDSITTIEIIEK